MKRRIGLYGGTFDPPHFGHLHLATEMLSRHALDEVWFIPTSIAPHKLDTHPADPEHRLKMVQLAIEGLPQFRALDLEVQRGGASYTVDTVNEILARPELAADTDLFLLMSAEYLDSLHTWKGVKQIIDKTTLLIGRRSTDRSPAPETGLPELDEAIKNGLNSMPVLEIRATDIRERIHQGLSCRHLVPARVLSYIYENQLYTA